MTFDPKTLNAEERALWDAMAIQERRNRRVASESYSETEGAFRDLLKARRALFGEPASETISADEDCNPRDHHWSWGFCHTCNMIGRRQEPAQPQPAKAPPSYGVLMSILNSLATKTISVGKAQKILMQWATGEKVDDFAEANEEAVHSMMFGDDEQPAPAVAMTEDLGRVLEFAASRHKDANTDTRVLWNQEYLVTVGKSIAAVRLQAAEAGKVPVEAIRCLLIRGSWGVDDEAYQAQKKAVAWLAELDAAEGRK